VAPGRVGWGSAILTEEASRRRGGGGGGSTMFRGGGGVPVASDKSDEVLQHDRTTGNEGRSMAKGDDGREWELTEGGSRR
jgi:hypothetical protein